MPELQPGSLTRERFNEVCEALWTEIEYQNALPRRTLDSEAKDVQGYATLERVYLRRLEDAWADNVGDEPALQQLRKCAALLVRGMAFCGIRPRVVIPTGGAV